MRTMRSILGLIGLLCLLPVNAIATATLTPSTPTTQVRKGERFMVYLRIQTQEAVRNLKVALTLPIDYICELKTSDPKALEPTSLEAGNSYILAYQITPPTFWKWYGSNPRDKKVFVFNVEYDAASAGSPKIRQAVELPTELVLPFYGYLLFGFFGAVVGSAIKVWYSAEHTKGEGSSASLWSTRDFFSGTLVACIAVFVVSGSGDLSPAKSWYDAAAIGVGAALVTKEQLFTKANR